MASLYTAFRSVLAIGFVLNLAFGHVAHAAPATRPSKPNIVYILADDLGYRDVGFMGGRDIKTPHLDALANNGTVLTSLYAQPVCSPTRASLLTGRLPGRTGVYTTIDLEAKWGLPLGERTLGDALKDAGYQTAIVGKWHLGKSTEAYRPTRRGFDRQYGNWYGMIDYFTHERNGVVDWHRDDRPSDDQGYSTSLDADEACRIVKDKPQGRPLFLYLAFNAPHAPLQAPPDYLKQYAHLKGKRARYAAVVTAMDDAVGRVVNALRDKGILDDTLIVFSSDNGGPQPGTVADNGPLRAGKGTLYEGGLRVAAFAHWPGHVRAGRTDQPVHISDWYPTLVNLAGGSLDQKLPIDGLDIWPTLTQGATSPHDAVLLCGGGPNRAAIRMGDWKLLLNANARDSEEAKDDEPLSGSVQLYDLSKDLGEAHDVAAENPAVVNRLRERLDSAMKGFVRSGSDAAREAASPN